MLSNAQKITPTFENPCLLNLKFLVNVFNRLVFLSLLSCFFLNNLSAQTNTLCANAIPLINGTTCDPLTNSDNTTNTAFDETYIGNCIVSEDGIGTLWYTYTPSSTAIVSIQTNAVFNDKLVVYLGTNCGNMTQADCIDKDEFGFTGEKTFVQITAGRTCYIQISGTQSEFGKCAGEVCIEIEEVSSFPSIPTNDDCTNAISLSINQNCVNGTTINATYQGDSPNNFEFARADVWYQFIPPKDTSYAIRSNAQFSEIITLYSGSCGTLTELVSNDIGQVLFTPLLDSGQTYFIQISGVFSTIEGDFCIQILEDPTQYNPCNSCPPVDTSTPPPGMCTHIDLILNKYKQEQTYLRFEVI